MTITYRLGTVPYSNVEPLIWKMENEPRISIESAVPRILAARFNAGEFDAALIPVFANFESGQASFISDACIACNGAVESVVLFSHVALEKITDVYLDVASLTSVNLLKILFAENDLECNFHDSTDLPAQVEKYAARLVIGDNALHMRGTFPVETDLGAWWKEMTGLGFIFAGWHARSTEPELIDLLQKHRDAGLANLLEVARVASSKHNLPIDRLQRYYQKAIRYKVTREERDGLQAFQFLCLKYGLV